MGNRRQPFRRQEDLRCVGRAGKDRLLVDALVLDRLQVRQNRVFEEILGIEVVGIGRDDDDIRVPDEQLLEIDRAPPFAGAVGRRIGHAAQRKVLRTVGDDLDLVGHLVDVQHRRKLGLVELANLAVEFLQGVGLRLQDRLGAVVAAGHVAGQCDVVEAVLFGAALPADDGQADALQRLDQLFVMGPLDHHVRLLREDRLDIRNEAILRRAGVYLCHFRQHLGVDALGEIANERILVHAGDIVRLGIDGAIDDRRGPDDGDDPFRGLCERDRLAAVIDKRTFGMRRCRQEKRQRQYQCGEGLETAGHGSLP
ncbi:hypothetical protein D3C72_1200650 [compost metagenome]